MHLPSEFVVKTVRSILRFMFLFFFFFFKRLQAKKQEGNDTFSCGKYQEAYDIYTEALTIDAHNNSTNAKLYYNRALVGSKVYFWNLVNKYIYTSEAPLNLLHVYYNLTIYVLHTNQ